MKYWVFTFLAITLGLFACRSTGKLTKRYASVIVRETTEDSIQKWAAINAYIFEVDKPPIVPPKTIFDLTPEGQKAFEKAIQQYEKTSSDFLANVAKTIATKKESPGFVDYTKFQKRFVISILDKNYFLADRVARFRITFSVSDKNIKITSCDKIVTKYETVDVGKQNYSNVTNASLTGTLGGSGKVTGATGTTTDAAKNEGLGTSSAATTEVNSSYGVTGTLGTTRTFAEEVLLKDRYVAVSGYITKNTVTLYEESVSGVKLTGNIIADISFEFDRDKAVKMAFVPDNLFKGNKPVHSDSIEIKDLYIYYPDLASDIEMTYTYEPLVRHVLRGDNTISEADDAIELLHQEVKPKEKVILLPKEQFEPKLWKLKSGTFSLAIKSPVNTGAGVMFFDSFDKAKNFLLWLRKNYTQINSKGNKLIFGNYLLEISDGSALTKNFVDNAIVVLHK
jgi:hypothetical protein